MATKPKHQKDGLRGSRKGVLARKAYDKELRHLQVDLLQLEEWIRHRGLRVVVLFEGRSRSRRHQAGS